MTTKLSPRVEEVVRLVALGNSCKEIAHKMGISGKTVEGHVTDAHKKLGVNNSVQLTHYAIRNGLVVL